MAKHTILRSKRTNNHTLCKDMDKYDYNVEECRGRGDDYGSITNCRKDLFEKVHE